MRRNLIAVLDVGKTHAKLIVTEAEGGRVVWRGRREAASLANGPLRRLDVAGIAGWLAASLAGMPERGRIGAFVPMAHGAAAMFLDARGEVLAAPDYEDPAFAEGEADYAALRGPFARTLSPSMPLGLNLGRQFHWLQRRAPEMFARVRHVLPHPQYWAWHLSGVMASEISSVGAHTDLWLPRERRFSPLALEQGWAELFPPLRHAADVLGPVRGALARQCGLDPDCRVFCGLHDSNASYFGHRAARGGVAPFTLVSSGTWCIVMSSGADPACLDEAADMLANVDIEGRPVPTARFMGGREFAAVAGAARGEPSEARMAELIARRIMALPGFAMGGPFHGRPGRLLGARDLDADGRATLASLYVALLTDRVLDLLGAEGDVIVDGPFAANALYGRVLAALRPGNPILASLEPAGGISGARHLALGAGEPAPALRRMAPLEAESLPAYHAEWRRLAGVENGRAAKQTSGGLRTDKG